MSTTFTNVPVLLIIFNRFDTASQVVSRLRAAAVKNLYIYCDGPRPEKTGESKQVYDVQQSVLKSIDWNCKVVTNYKEKNEGPRLAIGHAINWFFDNEDEGIILEHDCVPSNSFFTFCAQLLDHYRHDERIMHISGNNFQFGKTVGDGSYYFSKFTHIWGFATWKRAWKHYDVQMKLYPLFKQDNRVKDVFFHERTIKLWSKMFRETYENKIQTWDHQWTFAMWIANGLAIMPNKNLVSNVGFDEFALNTINPDHKLAAVQTHDLTDIVHPAIIIHNHDADTRTIDETFYPNIITYGLDRLKNLKRKTVSSLLKKANPK